MRYVYSFLAIVAGFLLVRFSSWIVSNFGSSDWAEAHLGTYGGTRLMWKLIGILFIVGALLVISGGMETLLYMIFKPFNPGAI